MNETVVAAQITALIFVIFFPLIMFTVIRWVFRINKIVSELELIRKTLTGTVFEKNQ